MALLNPTFQDPGARPGEAQHWTLSASTSLERMAAFGVARRAPEAFETWVALLLDLSAAALVRAFFDGGTHSIEDLEMGWLNDNYLVALPSGHVLSALFSGQSIDAFEMDWHNAAYHLNWSSLANQVARFSSDITEHFETRWRDNQGFVRAWEHAHQEAARFDGAQSEQEAFEGAWSRASSFG